MSKSPEATFRFGNVSSSVFVQETNGDGGPKRKFRTINVQKSYRDGDETKFGNSFTPRRLAVGDSGLAIGPKHTSKPKKPKSRNERDDQKGFAKGGTAMQCHLFLELLKGENPDEYIGVLGRPIKDGQSNSRFASTTLLESK